jgi:hypothetical protein
MAKNLTLNTLNDEPFEINNLIMKTFVQLFFENNAFIINNELLKLEKWMGQLVGLLKNSRIHIEFHSKLFIGTKNGLKNEMI